VSGIEVSYRRVLVFSMRPIWQVEQHSEHEKQTLDEQKAKADRIVIKDGILQNPLGNSFRPNS